MKIIHHIRSKNQPVEIISRAPAGYYCVLSLINEAIWYPERWEITPSPIEEPDPNDLVKRLENPNYLLVKNSFGHIRRDLFITALMWNTKLTETQERLILMYKKK